jgi:hypothetical protein
MIRDFAVSVGGGSVRRFGLLYDGPGARLVWLNVLIGCAALIPTFLQCSFFVFHESGKFVGQTSFLPEMFSMLLLLAIGEKGYVLCIPALLPACILLPALILTQSIPKPIKLMTAVGVVMALLIMSRTVAWLTVLFQQVGAKGMFT